MGGFHFNEGDGTKIEAVQQYLQPIYPFTVQGIVPKIRHYGFEKQMPTRLLLRHFRHIIEYVDRPLSASPISPYRLLHSPYQLRSLPMKNDASFLNDP